MNNETKLNTENKPVPQTERILNMLNAHSWVCGTSFQKEYMPTYAQRISDLRKRGYDIKSEKCDMLGHSHSGAIAKYQWNDYSGWINYETWNIALWINNDERLFNLAKETKTYEKFLEKINSNKHFYSLNNSIEIVYNTYNNWKVDKIITKDGVSFTDEKVNKKEIQETVFNDLAKE